MRVGQKKLRVMVVEDESRILATICRKIEAVAPECEIVATAANGEQALALIPHYRPHIVFTDIKMPVMDGLELAKGIKEKFSDIYVVIISGFSEFTFAQSAMKYGVFNYLLKPITENKLKDTIEEISEEIEKMRGVANRNIIMTSQEKRGEIDLVQHFAESKQQLFLISFNNLCYNNNDKVLIDYYTNGLNEIHWEEIMALVGVQAGKWILADEYALNQKSLILSMDGEAQHGERMAREIQTALERSCPELSCTICMHKEPIEREDIWFYIQRMRNILVKRMVIGQPMLYVLEEEEARATVDRTKFVENRIQNNIKKALQDASVEEGYGEIEKLYNYLVSQKASQKQEEKILKSILQLCQTTFKQCDEEKVKEVEGRLFRVISISQDTEAIKSVLLEVLKVYRETHEKNAEKQDVQSQIYRYVEENFRKIERVEDVAEVFNYNYTYLSRLFKKITGMSMTKYITQKRIEEAARIMQSQPALEIHKVGEMVGYKDQHYFSRIFKLNKGVSPSEFKEHIRCL